MPKTTWAPAARRIVRLSVSVAIIPFHCTASPFRSAVRRRSTANISRAFNVGEIHLASHAEQADHADDLLLIDSHDGSVADAMWKLFEIVISRCGPIPTRVEWDGRIPDWSILKFA
jgi:hypothetical protein